MDLTVSCQVRPMRSMATTTRVSPPARRLSRRCHPRRSWVPVEPETPMSRKQVLPGDTSPPELKLLGLGVHPGDALLEAAAGADVSVDLCHAPEFTLMQRLPQHGNDSLFALFHTPRFCNRGYQATSPWND